MKLGPPHVPTQWNSGIVQYFAKKWTSDSVGILKLMTLLKQQRWWLLSIYLGGHHVLSNACGPAQGLLCCIINQRLDSINTSDVFYIFWARLRHSSILTLRQHQSSQTDAALRHRDLCWPWEVEKGSREKKHAPWLESIKQLISLQQCQWSASWISLCNSNSCISFCLFPP